MLNEASDRTALRVPESQAWVCGPRRGAKIRLRCWRSLKYAPAAVDRRNWQVLVATAWAMVNYLATACSQPLPPQTLHHRSKLHIPNLASTLTCPTCRSAGCTGGGCNKAKSRTSSMPPSRCFRLCIWGIDVWYYRSQLFYERECHTPVRRELLRGLD